MQLQPSVSHHNSEAIIHIPIEILSQTTSTSCRPDWSRCANYVKGGTPQWAELSDGRPSDQMVDVLLVQIAVVDVSEIVRDDTFQGQVCLLSLHFVQELMTGLDILGYTRSIQRSIQHS